MKPVEHPWTLDELRAGFGDHSSCMAYLAHLRWSGGFCCPSCGSTGPPWRSQSGLMACTECRKLATPALGTVFEGPLPLPAWFELIWQIASQPYGADPKALLQQVELPSEVDAWTMLDRLGKGLRLRPEELLRSPIHLAQTVISSDDSERGKKRGRRSVVVIAVELSGAAVHRVQLARVASPSQDDIAAFAVGAIQTGSFVCSDAAPGYACLGELGFAHYVVGPESPEPTHAELAHAAQVAAALRAWLLASGPISHDHLDYYLDEFAFRFNHGGEVRESGAMFRRILEQLVPPADATPSQVSGVRPTDRPELAHKRGRDVAGP